MQHMKDPDTQVDRHFGILFHRKYGRYPSKQELEQFIRDSRTGNSAEKPGTRTNE